MPPTPPVRLHPSEAGFALLVAIISVLLIAAMIATGTQSDVALERGLESGATAPVRAREIALAGIAEALSWFRRQNVQPVTTFAPRLDPGATPPVTDTMDPAVGLVRAYEVTPGIWARYEVRLGVTAEPFTDLDGDGVHDAGEPFTDTNGSGSWDGAAGVRDVSAARGQPTAGAVWLVESRGYLFRRPRADLPLGTGANWRIGAATVATELRRMALKPPAAAALCGKRPDRVTISSRARIRGDAGAGIAYKANTGTPTLLGGSEVEGAPASTSVPGWKSGLKGVFGLTFTDLKAMADVSVRDAAVLPADLGAYTLTVIEGDVTFDEHRPLRGTGIVIVKGTCTIASGSNSFFNGLLWCSGKLVVRGPCYLRGTLIGQTWTEVSGAGGDYAELVYDGGMIDDLLTRMGTYRRSKAVFPVPRRPDEIVTGGGS